MWSLVYPRISANGDGDSNSGIFGSFANCTKQTTQCFKQRVSHLLCYIFYHKNIKYEKKNTKHKMSKKRY